MARAAGTLPIALIALALSFPLPGCTSRSSSGGAPGPLAPPWPISATADLDSITLTWPAVSGATSYNLYWATTPGVARENGNRIPGVTSPFLHGSLTAGTTYHYVLTTLRGALEGSESMEVSGTPFVPGVLDPTFGGVGWVTHHNAAGGDNHDYAWGMVLDGAGRIVVAGDSMDTAGLSDMVVWRYNEDGSLDTTFGGRGWITHDNAGGALAGWDIGWDVALDGTGRIVVAGDTDNPAGDPDIAVWRLLPDGTLDVSFNGQGWVTHGNAAGGDSDDDGYALTIDSQGRILVAGESLGTGGNIDMALWRFEENGTLDGAFGAGGVVVHHDAAGGNSHDTGFGVTTDASGRVFVTGFSFGPISGPDMAVWCYDDSGALDPTFGSGGIVVQDGAAGGSGFDSGYDIDIDASGKIVISGWSKTALGDDDAVVWRYNPDGTPDAAFGTGGVATHHDAAGGNRHDVGFDLVLVSTARILVTGRSENPAANYDMVVWAFDGSGAIDPSFGAAGVAVHNAAAGGIGWDFGRAIAVDGQGRIVVAGSSESPADQEMTIWRYR